MTEYQIAYFVQRDAKEARKRDEMAMSRAGNEKVHAGQARKRNEMLMPKHTDHT